MVKMSKGRRVRFLFAASIIAIFLVGCSEPSSINEVGDGGEVDTDLERGEVLPSHFTDERIDGMKGIVENEYLQLYVDDTSGAIAVHNKVTEKIWYSNPPNWEEDSVASGENKALLGSQMQLDFYNSYGQRSTINSYSESVVHEQVMFEEMTDGVRVSYLFGSAGSGAADLPLMLSAERYEDLLSRLESAGQRALMIAYRENSETLLYERNDNALSGLQLENAIKAFEDAGYTEEDWEQDMEELNFAQDISEARIFRASIEYTLEEDNLIVRVPVDSIEYPEEFPINMISFMNFFGAGGTEDEGSLFVPDGSGGLINFNSGNTQYPSYRQLVYGTDLTLSSTDDSNSTEEKVRLPVFGIIQEGDALFGIIEEGSSVARINADISGRLNSYNYVYPSFFVINKGDITINANEQQRTLPRFQEERMNTDYVIRYAFLGGEDASYAGMAKYYQYYLVNTNGLPPIQEENEVENVPFYLELVGSITKRKHFAGVPYQGIEALTTFEQAESILSEMQEREINNIKLNYSGWFNGGVNHKVPDSISVDKAVGGKNGLRNFVTFLEEEGIEFFPDVSILTANSGSGFRESTKASRSLTGLPAELYPMDLTINRRDRTKSPSYVVSPILIGDYTESILSDFLEYETGGISLRDMADQLNSDYRRNNQIYRPESETLSKQSLNKVHGEDLKIMANGGNAYSLPFLSHIINAPLTNSGYKIVDEVIPFYQMVVRGHINYTGQPYNLSDYTDVSQYILRSLEYGSNVHFKWIYEPNYKVKDTNFNYLYAVNYELWIDQATEIYHEVNEVLSKVKGEPIAEHEKLEHGVYRTEYNNGVYVIVNYNRYPVDVDGKTIEAQGYMTGGESL
ncbi:DUF5696 domain-containing protein [Bacillus alkalicellulosilyticus]|uniref:DUF5696 domain-containing protein n=1 Tax=Alkalihalobacterium alkalicellulosilyticum TaxID=1912214 RepID=UPI001FE7020A|nr:DUF5696 domain-containing protein [Bacillus alkalicellulosilyticus]